MLLTLGSGLGTILNVFKNNSVDDVLGIDGAWVNKELLYKNISESEFIECNLEKQIKLNQQYDLVISLEVAEHLSENAADTFVQSLVNAGSVVVFSAAIPHQGGQNHINEQWLSYWEEKFSKHNYVIHDILRPIFWDHPEVFWWYKQNMVLFVADNHQLNLSGNVAVPMRNLVHYQLYQIKAQEAQDQQAILTGQKSIYFYLKMLLFSIFGYNRLMKLKKSLSIKR